MSVHLTCDFGVIVLGQKKPNSGNGTDLSLYQSMTLRFKAGDRGIFVVVWR